MVISFLYMHECIICQGLSIHIIQYILVSLSSEFQHTRRLFASVVESYEAVMTSWVQILGSQRYWTIPRMCRSTWRDRGRGNTIFFSPSLLQNALNHTQENALDHTQENLPSGKSQYISSLPPGQSSLKLHSSLLRIQIVSSESSRHGRLCSLQITVVVTRT